MGGFLISMLFGTIIVGVIAGIVFAVNSTKENHLDQRLKSIQEFSPDLTFKSGTCENAIAIDRSRRKIAVLLNPIRIRPVSFEPIVYSFDDLIAVEVIKDDMSITKTNRGSQAAGAAIGGILLGPAGLLLGGLSGSKRNENKITKLSLKLYTTDLALPVQEILFWDSGNNGVDPNALNHVINEMDQWYGRLRAITATPTGKLS